MMRGHYAKAMIWTERQFARLPVVRRSPERYAKGAKIAALAVVGLLVVNEVRGLVLLATLGPPAVTASYKAVKSAVASGLNG